ELTFLHALVEPGGAEDEAAQPVHEAAVGGADELGPAVVDVLAERRCGVRHLAVDGEVDEVLELELLEPAADEAELASGLLDAFGEVALVEREAELPVFENVVVTGVVIAAANVIHGSEGPGSPGRLHLMLGSCPRSSRAEDLSLPAQSVAQ